MSACCPHCGQPLPLVRFGVKLPPLKTRIVDLVERAGPGGIAGNDLFDLVYGNNAPSGKGIRTKRSRRTIHSHVNQINELIADSGFRISGRNATSTYRLERAEPTAPYDGERDAWRGVSEAYREIRRRQAGGGKGWEPR